jgi:hypothetical protein
MGSDLPRVAVIHFVRRRTRAVVQKIALTLMVICIIVCFQISRSGDEYLVQGLVNNAPCFRLGIRSLNPDVCLRMFSVHAGKIFDVGGN